MSDGVKNYVVNYIVQTNIGNAASALQKLADAAKAAANPLKTATTSINNLVQNAERLSAIGNKSFVPKIDLSQFEKQLKTMVSLTRTAAAEMHEAIYGALSGNAPAKKAVTNSASKAYAGMTKSAIKDEINKLKAQRDQLDKQLKAGGTTYSKGHTKTPQWAQIQAFDKLIKAAEKAYATADKATEKVGKKMQNNLGKAVTSKSPAVTNLVAATEEQLKTLDKLLNGKNKSRSIKITANASAFNNTFKSIQNKLNSLKPKSIELTPTLNQEAFIKIKDQLETLATIPVKFVMPKNLPGQGNGATKDQNKKGGKQSTGGTTTTKSDKKATGEKKTATPPALTKEQQRHQERLARTIKRYEENNGRTDLNKGQKLTLAKDKKWLTQQGYFATKPATPPSTPKVFLPNISAPSVVKVVADQALLAGSILNCIKALPPQTIKLMANVVSENGAVGTRIPLMPGAKVPTPQTSSFPKLPLKPWNNILTGGSTQGASNAMGTTGFQPTIPPLTVNSSNPVGSAQDYAERQQRASSANPGTSTDKTAAPTGFHGTGTNRVFWGAQKPMGMAPEGYKWVKTAGLDTKLNSSQAEGYQKALMAQNSATANWQKVRAETQSAFQSIMATSPQNKLISSLTEKIKVGDERYTRLSKIKFHAKDQINRINAALRPWQEQYDQLTAQEQSLTSLKKLNSQQRKILGRVLDAKANTKAMMTPLLEERSKWQNQVDRARGLQRTVNNNNNNANKNLLQEQRAERTRQLQPLINQRAAARETYKQASGASGAYTNGWMLQSEKPATPAQAKPSNTSSASKNPPLWSKANQMQQALMPFASNKTQMNLLSKYHRFFELAQKKTGITAMPNMSNAQMLKYLQGVSTLMNQYNVAVPYELQQRINTLQNPVPIPPKAPASYRGGTGWASTRAMVKPSFYDKAKRWGYPFAGNTSFGARTPMAVEMAKGMGVMFAIGGAMSTLSDSFGQAMEYQDTMKATQGILKISDDNYSESSFKDMSKVVRNIGVKTKFSAPEVANAARFLAMSGKDTRTIETAMQYIADVALVGRADLGEVADKMTNIMSVFNLDANQMKGTANVLTTTASRSNTDVMMLAESAKYGGPVAQMYNRNDPNIFADTMALFGVMGNSGIQGSSAGTALRMMYQNIFNPNKKQQKIIDQYKIQTHNSDGSNKSMLEVVQQLAQLPEQIQADVIGKLFRITAQPGANAAIVSSMIKEEVDEETAAGAINNMNLIADITTDKKKGGLSALMTLMQANRASVDTNIAHSQAEEQQKTIKGLWAQVTSTFTEGVVQAFEQRQGGFEGMLTSVRDYLAKPQTVAMLQNLLDLVVAIVKVMGKFAKIWAGFYSAAPKLIEFWVTTQMFFTQFGALLSPFIALTGVINRFGTSLAKLGGITMATNASMAGSKSAWALSGATGLGYGAASGAPIIMANSAGKMVTLSGRTAIGARNAMATQRAMAMGSSMTNGRGLLLATSAASMGLPITAQASPLVRSAINGGTGMNGFRVAGARPQGNLSMAASTIAPAALMGQAASNNITHYADVQSRYNRRFGAMGRFKAGFRNTYSGITSAVTGGGLLATIKNLFISIASSIGKILGAIFNPVSGAAIAIGALGICTYKAVQWMTGNSEAQKIAAQKNLEMANQTYNAFLQQGEFYRNLNSSDSPISKGQLGYVPKSETEIEAEKRREALNSKYAIFKNDFSKDASAKSNNKTWQRWRETIHNNPELEFAFGDKYEEFVSNDFVSDKRLEMNKAQAKYGSSALSSEKLVAKFTRDQMAKGAVVAEATSDPELRSSLQKLKELTSQYYAKQKGEKDANKRKANETEYKNTVAKYRKELRSKFSPTLSVEGKKDKNGKIIQPGVTAENFFDIPDFSNYKEYVDGVMNIMDAYINGKEGTFVGQYLALQEVVGKTFTTAELFQNEFVRKVISNFTIQGQFFDKQAQQVKQIDVAISLMPDGKLNMPKIEQQIKDKINNFKASIEDFSRLTAKVYEMLADITGDGSKDGAVNYVRKALIGKKLSKNEVLRYYDNNIANNPNSEWVKAGIGREAYWNFLRSGGSIRTSKRTVTADDEIGVMKWGMAHDAVDSMNTDWTKYDDKDENSKTTPTSSPTAPSAASNQTAYAPHYDRSAARPTQINMHFNNMCNFDKTTIASSADERDMMAALESKIANSVYQIFAEASNQAQRVYDMA